MNNDVIRDAFLRFFEGKGHRIVSSAPIVNPQDPTLLFTNAGMNPFKDLFLGNQPPTYSRVANSQKCLRVSGKHNDLEEVGVDHYHHTMFEMLGNWSFGDYFKKDAILWAWEFLTQTLNLDPKRMYVTVFEGDPSENLDFDHESDQIWRSVVNPKHILRGNKKDNFWEMGETGPCGPCSEIHFDMRSDADRAHIDGASLVNQDHEEVIEIWNLVFMEFNRNANGSLSPLPNKHVDTGMGFERLTRVLQNKKSNYDTDIFMPTLNATETLCNISYKGSEHKQDIAFRVIADHIRAIAFTIADGQLPASNGAGYVVRRILRRAVRYGYSFLNIQEPFLHKLLPVVAQQFQKPFPEVFAQQEFIAKVIFEEEQTFLRTLQKGIDLLQKAMAQNTQGLLSGKTVFELYDTFGFPLDLTQLIAAENQFKIDIEEFERELQAQKQRSRSDAQKNTGDWVVLSPKKESEFIGYDSTTTQTHIVKYRQIEQKGKTRFQLVLEHTPFYPEGGGQVGDTGFLVHPTSGERIQVVNTSKENNLIVHLCNALPSQLQGAWTAEIHTQNRLLTTRNHSATHLLHAALRQVLGKHVTQKGSLVNPHYLRFDISHFAKITPEELTQIEQLVNQKISEGIPLNESRNIPIQQALDAGAMALFGEKYGEQVRMIQFDPNFSTELCGGTHVANTAQIGIFKIVAESSVAAGVRRIEAITSSSALQYFNEQEQLLSQLKDMLNQSKNLIESVAKLKEENEKLSNQVQSINQQITQSVKKQLSQKLSGGPHFTWVIEEVTLPNAQELKDLCFQLRNEHPKLIAILGAHIQNKPMLAMVCGTEINESQAHAGKLIKSWAPLIKGGGGGQSFFATAGGSFLEGLQEALEKAKQWTQELNKGSR